MTINVFRPGGSLVPLFCVVEKQNDSIGLNVSPLSPTLLMVVIGAGKADPPKVLAASINFSQTITHKPTP